MRRAQDRIDERLNFLDKRFSDCTRCWMPRNTGLLEQHAGNIVSDLKQLKERMKQFTPTPIVQQQQTPQQNQVQLVFAKPSVVKHLETIAQQYAERKDQFVKEKIVPEQQKIDAIFNEQVQLKQQQKQLLLEQRKQKEEQEKQQQEQQKLLQEQQAAAEAQEASSAKQQQGEDAATTTEASAVQEQEEQPNATTTTTIADAPAQDAPATNASAAAEGSESVVKAE